VKARPLLKLVPRRAKYLSSDTGAEAIRRFHRHEATGRRVGSDWFLARLERIADRLLRPQRPGRKKRTGKK